MAVRPVKTWISQGIRPVWSESSLCAQWVAKDPSFLHVDSENSDQTGQMPRLIWVFAGCACHFVGFVMRWLICSQISKNLQTLSANQERKNKLQENLQWSCNICSHICNRTVAAVEALVLESHPNVAAHSWCNLIVQIRQRNWDSHDGTERIQVQTSKQSRQKHAVNFAGVIRRSKSLALTSHSKCAWGYFKRAILFLCQKPCTVIKLPQIKVLTSITNCCYPIYLIVQILQL